MCGIPIPRRKPVYGRQDESLQQANGLQDARERFLRHIRQLTFGGENAEAYFSFDGKKLIFQSTRPPFKADQIFTMNIDGSEVRLVSTGKGRCTCGFWSPDGKKILYSSTDWMGDEPPPPPDRSQGYVWGLFPYRLYIANADGSQREAITDDDAYNAEGSFHPKGDRILFTTTRYGNIDLCEYNLRTRQFTRLTDEIGYNGGAFYSWDGKYIVYRAYHPKTREEIEEFQRLLKLRLVRPSKLELWVMTADGKRKWQVSRLGGANFAPFMRPGNRQIIFSSNHHDPRGREFDLFLINLDGTGLQRVTYTPEFDGFPMFSRDGKKLVWASNRNAKVPGETNIFIADFVG
jgi:TolB protein